MHDPLMSPLVWDLGHIGARLPTEAEWEKAAAFDPSRGGERPRPWGEPERKRYRVLRGGSWASGPGVARTTLRNWDRPGRWQIFAAFRCAYREA